MFNKKKLLSLLLSFTLLFSLFAGIVPSVVSAAPETGSVVKIYFKDTNAFPSKFPNRIFAYLTNTNVSPAKEQVAYPGTAMDYLGANADGHKIYAIDVDTSIYNTIKFSDGTGTSPNNRTNNFTTLLTAPNNGYTFTGSMDTKDAKYYGVKPAQIDIPNLANTKVNVYFKDTNVFPGKFPNGIFAYLSKSGGANNVYPGKAMTFLGNNSSGDKIYVIEVDTSLYNTIKFSDGTGASDSNRTDTFTALLSAPNNGYTFTGLMDTNDKKYYGVKPANIDLDSVEIIPAEPNLVTIYYKDSITWGDPYIYAKNSTNSNQNVKIPGERMEFIGMEGATRVYAYTLDANIYDRIRFYDGTILGHSVPNRRTGEIDFMKDIADGYNGYELSVGNPYYIHKAISVDAGAIQAYEGIKTDTKVKNVIYMIGDGFGAVQAEAGTLYKGAPLVFQGAGWYSSYQTTHSADYPKFTDSAAAGTALATGVKVKDSVVGIAPNGEWVENLVEFSKVRGLKTGLVVTQVIPHATPASFSAHIPSRHSYDDIATHQIKENIDVMFGAGASYFNSKKTLMSDFEYAYITNFSDLANVDPNQKVIGAFKDTSIKYNDVGIPSLAEMSVATLDRLDGKNGFFVMIEGSDIDSYAHGSNMADMLGEIIAFDKSIQVAQDYVDAHPDTLLLVTADHETGGLDLTGVTKKEQLTNSLFKSGGTHTAVPVPVYAYGAGAEELTQYDIIDNTEIHKFVTDVLNNQYGVKAPKILSDDNNVIYFEKPESWDDVYVYSDTYLSTKNAPGGKMTLLEGNIYAFTTPFSVAGMTLSFNDGTGKSSVIIKDPEFNELYYVTADEDTDSATVAIKDYSPPAGVLYFEKPGDWKDAYIYTWDGIYGGEWPGKPMEKVEGNLYKFVLSSTTTLASGFKLIFNEGPVSSGTTKQTINLDFMAFNLLYKINGTSSTKFTTSFEKYPALAEDNEPAGTLYFKKPSSWTGAYVYTFFGSYLSPKPGEPMEQVEEDVYSFTLSKGQMLSGGHTFKLIFSDGKNYETVNVPFAGFNRMYTISTGEMSGAAVGLWSDYVEKVTIDSISIKTPATKLNYLIGENLDVSGLTIEVSYSDGTVDNVPVTAEMVTGFNSSDAVESQTLTITYEGNTVEYTIMIGDVEIPATGISLNQSTANMAVGEHVDLIATITPSNATEANVVWSSSDNNIATVADGRVTAVAVGTVTITATIGQYAAISEITITAVKVVAPANIKAVAMGQGITLSWDAVAGANKYRVYSNGAYQETRGTTLFVSLVNGTYVFEVSAVTQGGVEGEKGTSNKVVLTYGDFGNGNNGNGNGNNNGNPPSKPEEAIDPDQGENPIDKEKEEGTSPVGSSIDYKDIKKGHWASTAIDYLSAREIILGYADQSYRPDQEITRAEFAALLVRAFGLKQTGEAKQFSDVTNNKWYQQFVDICSSLGLINGFSDGSFKPEDSISRQDMALLIHTVLIHQGINLDPVRDGEFKDSGLASAYAADALHSLYQADLINGTGNDMFQPKDIVTRAQIAQILYNILMKIEGLETAQAS